MNGSAAVGAGHYDFSGNGWFGDPESDIPLSLLPKHVIGLHAADDMAMLKVGRYSLVILLTQLTFVRPGWVTNTSWFCCVAASTHCCRRGRKFDFGSQSKFHQNMLV